MGKQGTRNVKRSPTLTVVRNQEEDLSDEQYTAHGFYKFIATFLKEEGGSDVGMTPEHILNGPTFAGLWDTCVKGYKAKITKDNAEKAKKRRIRDAEMHQLKIAKAKELDAKMREKFGLPAVLTPEQIKAQLQPVVVSKPEPAKIIQTVVVEEVDRAGYLIPLLNQYAKKLPDFIFDGSDYAVMFRWVLKRCVQPLREKLKDQSLEVNYRADIRKRYDQVQSIFPMADKVITQGWGLDLTTSIRNDQLCKEVVDNMLKDERFVDMTWWMGRCPSPEDLKAGAEMKNKAKAEEEQKQIVREKSREEISAMLITTGYSVDESGTIAHAIVRSFHKVCKGDIKEMFRQKAIDKSGDQSPEGQTMALRCAQLAGMSPDQFKEALANFQTQKARHSFIEQSVNNSLSPKKPQMSPTPSAPTKQVKKDRKAKVRARSEADYAAKPKPNNGSGDIAAQSMGKGKGGK